MSSDKAIRVRFWSMQMNLKSAGVDNFKCAYQKKSWIHVKYAQDFVHKCEQSRIEVASQSVPPFPRLVTVPTQQVHYFYLLSAFCLQRTVYIID